MTIGTVRGKENLALGAAALAMALAGCGANHNSIYRYQPLEKHGPAIVSVDAKQRLVIVSGPDPKSDPAGLRMYCAEPSPDVYSVLAQSFTGSANGGTGTGGAINAAVQAAFK